MPTQGLRILTEQQQVVFDTTSRAFIILGIVANTGQGAGSITVPEFANYSGEKDFDLQSLGGLTDEPPQVTISGTTLSWTFRVNNNNLNAPHKITYGIW